MTAFGKLIRTTAFRLTLVYLFLFAFFAASLLGYFAWNTRRLITEQITTTVNGEISEVTDIYSHRGLRALVFTVESRALRPGANLYLVTTPTGQAIAGNVGSLMPGVMASTENTSCPVGRIVVSSFVKFVATTAFVTSMTGDSPTTVTVSATLPTDIVTFSVAVKPAVI